MTRRQYAGLLGLRDTQRAIKMAKDIFERELAAALNLERVSAPLFVLPETGLNDNLNGSERPVSFDIKQTGEQAQIVHSLAKWKRHALGKYSFEPGTGLYTDMNAIRRDEVADEIHSIYVDQWDWERVITRQERTQETLRYIVRRIYSSLRATRAQLVSAYPVLGVDDMPVDISFISSQELLDRYPELPPSRREYEYVKEVGVCFVEGIGGVLSDGKRHDGRAPDYDDWALNGDLLVYYKPLDIALELSSMGIRVDAAAMERQLAIAGMTERAALPFHKAVLEDRLPLSIGGGIGQSRLCMYFLKKTHIGQVQASIWPQSELDKGVADGCELL